jgi:hypothetical protein
MIDDTKKPSVKLRASTKFNSNKVLVNLLLESQLIKKSKVPTISNLILIPLWYYK